MAEETRRKIIDAAEKLIYLKGLSRVTTKEIAREVGLSDGALYRHFDHKEEIFFALMARHLPTLLETIQARQAGTGALNENLVDLARAIIHYYEQLLPMGASFLADTQLLTQFRAIVQPRNLGPHNLVERVAAYIEEEQQVGRISQQVSALSIAALLLGACLQRVFFKQLLGTDPFNKTDQQFAEEVVQGLIVGLLPS